MELVVFQFVPFASFPVTGCHWKTLAPPSLHFGICRHWLGLPVSLSFLGSKVQTLSASPQRKHAPVPWWPYIGLFAVLGAGAELDTALQVWHHQCSAEQKDNFSWPAHNILPNEAKNGISLLSSKCTLLTYVQLRVHQDPLVLFYTAAFQLGGP